MLTIENNLKKIGKDVKIFEPVALIQPERITLANHIIISEFAYLSAGLGIFIGNYIHVATHSSISGGGYCVLDDFSGISAGCRVITGSAELTGNGLTNPMIHDEFGTVYISYVHLEKHSLLSSNVIVHPGITIGEGTVVASGSVVTKSLEPWGIYMGSPAKRVRDRPKKKMLELEKKIYQKDSIAPSDFSSIIEKMKALKK
jgi:acetyltransferase-like isoleucine patch superfamily enzyme